MDNKQLKIEEECSETLDILYPPEDIPTMDSYYIGIFKNIEDYLSNADNKKTPTIKKEYRKIKEKLYLLHKDGEVSDSLFKELSKKVRHLDGVFSQKGRENGTRR